MACNSCTKSFSFLRKENGCPGCGFSYCSNCLNNKVFLPKINSETKVCSKCKRLESDTNKKKEDFLPPDAYYKRLTAAQEKAKVDEIEKKLQNLKKDTICTNSPMTTEEEIARRLQNIKGLTPSTEELKSRLAKLRGQESFPSTTKETVLAPDVRTEQEQADDLIKQYIEQAKIDNNYKKDYDLTINNIESRVQNLTNPSGSLAKNTLGFEDVHNADDENEDLKIIIEKVKAESLLEYNEILNPADKELPFCEICNEDARMRCLGCRYLFCNRCFLEHKDEDDGCDRYELYNSTENC